MIASVTEMGVYRRCRRQWLINSRNRWGMTKIVSPKALSLGTLVHSTLGLWLEMYKQHQETGDPDLVLPDRGLAELFRQFSKEKIEEAKKTYRQQIGAEIDDSELAPLYESVEMGYAMMINYQAYWKIPVPPDFDVIATEQRCVVPIPGTEHTTEYVWEHAVPDSASGAQFVPGAGWLVKRTYDEPVLHYYEGKLDGIIRKQKTGELYVLEHKTYGQRPREDVLHTNDQFMGYHWILLNLADSMGLDPRKVAGVAYDGLWKRAAPPKMVDNHKGEIKDLFSRRLIQRPVQEIVEFEDMLAATALEMGNGPYHTKHRTSDGSCFWACSDNPLCLSMTRGEDTAWLLKSQYTRKAPDEDMDPERVAVA